ncbi:PKD domain-containing protein [Halorussus sp. AFM4]|uniref:PKD domain-containing protein n=1 Tax=Halorussus sp. AFM4 TaxID=3421651 RepID=UPI003EC0893B
MTERARSVLLTLLLVVSTLSTVGVGAATATAAAANSSTGTFHVSQAGNCYEVTAYGSGDQTVEEFYDYRKPNNTDPDVYTYSSHGTKHLQENQVSNLFVYNGSGGYSLVMLHDKLDEAEEDGPNASTITFEFSNMSHVDWKVRDDNYTDSNGDPQDDNWDTKGDTHVIDWMWGPHRTDGGAFTGIADGSVTISPQFNDDAKYWNDWEYSGDDANKTEQWRLLDNGGQNVSLDMQKSVTIKQGGCPDTTDPSAALSASSNTVANNEAVTFDASNSSDNDGGSGIAEYRWDFDGNGTVDRNTTDATVSHTYESTGEYTASVTVVDNNGNTDTATTTITVESSDTSDPTVDVSAPETVNVSETFEVSASASDESKVESYEWDFNGTTKTGSTVSHNYSRVGNHTVTLTWTDSDGESHTETVEIEAVNPDDGDTSPTVESFQVSNPENETLRVSFLGSASITDITANVTDANGTVVATLNESDFDASDAGDYQNYVATTTVESAGTYAAELVTAADADGDDAADGQTDSTYVGTVEGEINYVNATHVWVNGTFDQVSASVGFYDGSGYGQSMIRKTNVSGSTLISSEGMGGVNGSLINLVEADVDNSTAGDSLRKEHPRLDYYAERIEPRPVTTSVENVTAVGNGSYEVTFGYANPNNESLTMPNSTFSGDVSGTAPETFESGEHNFTVTWTPVSDDERAAWTLNRSAFGQSDVTARTKTAAQYGGIVPKIEFVNESAVRVTGDFAAVNLTTVSFTADGKQTATRTFGNVSGETLLTPSDDATWGPVTEKAAAFHNASDSNATISVRNPNYSSQLDEVRPEKVSTFVASANKTGNNTYEVTFGYVNPNDHAMNASASAFAAGNTSDQPPATFAPGRHTFTANWTPESNESNLVWKTDFSNFGYTPSTATSPTPDQIAAGEMPPTAELSVGSNTVNVNETVTFDASNSSDDANVAKYLWDFDSDDEIDRNTTDSATIGHVYRSPGTYEVTVTVVDESGQTDTASETVVVVKPVVDDAPTAHLDAVSEVHLGETLVLDARESIDDRGIVWVKYYVDGELLWAGNPNATPERTSLDTQKHLDGTGTYEFTVKVWDNKHQSDTSSETVEVLPADNDDEEKDSGDNGDSDGDHHDDDDNEHGYNDDDGDNTGSRSGSIGGASPDNNNDGGDSSDDTQTVSAPMRDADSRVGKVVVTASGSNADPAVDVTASAPAGVTAPTVAEDGFAALSYLNVSGANQATFTVAKSRLQASDASADAVSLFRYDGGAWSVVETAQVNQTADAYEFRANVSDGVYAVGVGKAVTSVADVSVDSQRVEPGQQVTVTATIENTGHADGTREVELTVGGEVVATKTVSVAADGTTEVTFTRTFDESGVYSVGVGDASAEVVVKGIQTQTTTEAGSDSQTTTETTTSDSSSGVPGFGVGVSLVALLAAALLARRRQ